MFNHLSAVHPRLVTVLNADVLDASSWHVSCRLAETVSSILFIFSVRGLPESLSDLLAARRTNRIILHRLTDTEMMLLVQARLKATWMEPELEDYILQRSQGLPVFVKELVGHLMDSKAIEVDATTGRCTIRQSMRLANVPVPPAMASNIGAQLDKLSFAQQAFLRTGAVIGTAFSFSLLTLVFPFPISADNLRADSAFLVHANFLRLIVTEVNGSPVTFYEFVNSAVMEIAYLALTSQQREDLHRKIARCIEQSGTSDDPRTDWFVKTVELLYHDAMGGNDANCFFYLDQAKALNIDVKEALQSTGHTNLVQVARVIRAWLINRISLPLQSFSNWRRMSVSVAQDFASQQSRLGPAWVLDGSPPKSAVATDVLNKHVRRKSDSSIHYSQLSALVHKLVISTFDCVLL